MGPQFGDRGGVTWEKEGCDRYIILYPKLGLEHWILEVEIIYRQRDEVELSINYRDFQNPMFKAKLGTKFMSLLSLIKLKFKTNMSFQV